MLHSHLLADFQRVLHVILVVSHGGSRFFRQTHHDEPPPIFVSAQTCPGFLAAALLTLGMVALVVVFGLCRTDCGAHGQGYIKGSKHQIKFKVMILNSTLTAASFFVLKNTEAIVDSVPYK